MEDVTRTARINEVEHRFSYHPQSEELRDCYNQIAEKAKEFAVLILELTPACREQSSALRKLEEAVFWINASIARNEA